jgi:hypothetical protein
VGCRPRVEGVDRQQRSCCRAGARWAQRCSRQACRAVQVNAPPVLCHYSQPVPRAHALDFDKPLHPRTCTFDRRLSTRCGPLAPSATPPACPGSTPASQRCAQRAPSRAARRSPLTLSRPPRCCTRRGCCRCCATRSRSRWRRRRRGAGLLAPRAAAAAGRPARSASGLSCRWGRREARARGPFLSLQGTGTCRYEERWDRCCRNAVLCDLGLEPGHVLKAGGQAALSQGLLALCGRTRYRAAPRMCVLSLTGDAQCAECVVFMGAESLRADFWCGGA